MREFRRTTRFFVELAFGGLVSASHDEYEEFEAELRRVGVDWGELQRLGGASERWPLVAIAHSTASPVLRAPPDGAGTAAFLERLGGPDALIRGREHFDRGERGV